MASRPFKILIRHEAALNKFIGTIPEKTGACVLDYRYLTPTSVDFYRTVTDQSLQGLGVGAEVVGAGFQWARDSNLKVSGSCSFVDNFIRKNPQWADISKL